MPHGARRPLPSSNRTCGFPASGFHANSRCRAVRRPPSRLSSAAKPRSKMRTVPQPCGWVSVGGLSSKRNSHPLTQRVCVPAPSLHGGYPLPRYYGPVRLPDEAALGLCIPLGRWPACAGHPAGSPRFLGRSVRARRPLSPRKARWVHAPVASPPAAGFTILGRLATFIWCNEAVSGSLALRLTRSLPGASPGGSLHLASGSLPVERAIDRVTSSQVTRSARLRLAHPRHQGALG